MIFSTSFSKSIPKVFFRAFLETFTISFFPFFHFPFEVLSVAGYTSRVHFFKKTWPAKLLGALNFNNCWLIIGSKINMFFYCKPTITKWWSNDEITKWMTSSLFLTRTTSSWLLTNVWHEQYAISETVPEYVFTEKYFLRPYTVAILMKIFSIYSPDKIYLILIFSKRDKKIVVEN